MKKNKYEEKYKEIINYLNNTKQNYILLTNKNEFYNLCKEQNKTPLYTKLKYKCIKCGKEYNRSFACIKASKSIGMCKNCSVKFPTKKYEEVIKKLNDNGYSPLFSKEDYTGVKMKARCIACCGHEVYTSIDSMLSHPMQKCHKCSIKYGSDVYNWKGGYSSEREKIRRTFEFKNFVKSVLKRDNYTCIACGRNSKETKMVVHHKDGYNWCEEKRMSVDNGVTLCECCHKKFHEIYGKGNNTKEQFKNWLNIALYSEEGKGWNKTIYL